MKQYIFRLDENSQRPTLMLKNGLTALLDTGAYIPVWTDDEEVLVSELGGQLVGKDVSFSGFGGETKGNLYILSFDLDGIFYPQMHIVANSELDVPFNLILNATMFDRLIYQIDTVNNVLNVDVPDKESNIRNLRVVDSEGRLHVLCSSAE